MQRCFWFLDHCQCAKEQPLFFPAKQLCTQKILANPSRDAIPIPFPYTKPRMGSFRSFLKSFDILLNIGCNFSANGDAHHDPFACKPLWDVVGDEVIKDFIQRRTHRLLSRIPIITCQIPAFDTYKIYALFIIFGKFSRGPKINSALSNSLLWGTLDFQSHLRKEIHQKPIQLPVFPEGFQIITDDEFHSTNSMRVLISHCPIFSATRR